mgnify:CR=1 FL=1
MNGFLISEDGNIAIKLSNISTISFNELYLDNSVADIKLNIVVNNIEIGIIPKNSSIKNVFMKTIMNAINDDKTISISGIKSQLSL